jgi:hypothetical protein
MLLKSFFNRKHLKIYIFNIKILKLLKKYNKLKYIDALMDSSSITNSCITKHNLSISEDVTTNIKIKLENIRVC